VEVPLHAQGVNLGQTERKSDRSADASGARSQAPFSLPEEALRTGNGLKNLFVVCDRKLTGDGQDK